jgi:hypothetical protein
MDATQNQDAASANSIQGRPDIINGIAKKYGLPKPKILLKDEALSREAQSQYARALSVMPQSIARLFPQSINPLGNNVWPDIPQLREALAKQYPDQQERILALLAWYGSAHSTGYGEFPRKLLQEYSFTDLWSEARSDRLTNAELSGAAQFFADKYLSPRDEHNRAALQSALMKYADEMAAWLRIMPPSIRPLWHGEEWRSQYYGQVDGRVRADEELMLTALAQEFPDKTERILALLAWYGADAGGKRIFGPYQAVVDNLLYRFSTSEFAQALVATTLTEQQLDGATRLFAEYDFRRGRREEIRALPSSLKTVLLAHSKYGADEERFKRMFAPPVPVPGDGVFHAFVEPIVPGDDNVALVTVEETRAEPQFAPLMVPGTPIDDRLDGHAPTREDGGPCINTGRARYILNKQDHLLFEILADCGGVMRGYGYVICRINGDLRCAEAADWYFTGRTYQLTGAGLKVGTALHSWKDPTETPARLQAMAARIDESTNRSLQRHASRGRWINCYTLDPPNSKNTFACSLQQNLEMCRDYPNLDDIRDGDTIDMNSPAGRWVTKHSRDSDSPKWACWVETQ